DYYCQTWTPGIDVF
nr:immunoglobulin light chain junction region [Macaca mulatta]MOY17589.1 immunoglobulin light chain junction region [Macaca mulatta]